LVDGVERQISRVSSLNALEAVEGWSWSKGLRGWFPGFRRLMLWMVEMGTWCVVSSDK